MLETPRIVETADQRTAFIHLTVPRSQIKEVMGPGLRELMAAVSAQDIRPTGPWFTHHLRLAPDVFDFELSVPVPSPVTASGRVAPGRWPATRVVRTIYQGPYEGLGAAWEEFDEWILAHGHTPGPDLWESYLAGPESSPDPAAFRTELSRNLGPAR